jgi:hypothetical protein
MLSPEFLCDDEGERVESSIEVLDVPLDFRKGRSKFESHVLRPSVAREAIMSLVHADKGSI